MVFEESERRKKEHPNTYIVQDRSSEEELKRLRLQDQMLTQNMGGLLPEQNDISSFQRVLDVGCGTGGWLIDLARTYPFLERCEGADVSRRMVEYARDQAEAAGVADRVSFHVMDALRMLEFPRNVFDLVNHRLGFSYLRTWDWPNLLQEYQRVARPGGIIRITETEIFLQSNSAAYNQLVALAQDAFFRAGHLFTEGCEGVISALPALLHQQGLVNVQTRTITMEYTTTMDQPASAFFEDMRLVFRTMLPFLRKWTQVPSDYEEVYQRMLADMQQPGFHCTGKIMTVWGSNAQYNNKIPEVEHH